MMQQNLYERFQQFLKDEEYLEALSDLLCLRESGIDLEDVLDAGAGIAKLGLVDIDRNTVNEIAVQTRKGILSFWFRSQQKSEPVHLNHHYWHSFCPVRSAQSADIEVIVARTEKTGSQIEAHRFKKTGGHSEFGLHRHFPVHLSGKVLDMAAIGPKVYVSTSDKLICQYHANTGELEAKLVLDSNVRRLFAEQSSSNSASVATNGTLLGISTDRGILLFSSRGRELTTSSRFGEDTQFIGVSSADTDNDGQVDIVACTHSGKIIIYNRDTRSIKYECSLADELYDVVCHDFDDDGQIEILVGAKGNRIYILRVNVELGELKVAKVLPTDHRVWRLLVSESDSKQGKKDKRLFAGLADGTVQVFRFFPHAEINRRIYDTMHKFKASEPEWAERLLNANKPELVRYGLDQVAREMRRSEIVAFLERATDPKICRVILSKLGVLLAIHLDAHDLFESAKAMMQRMFTQNSDLPTCERICQTLDELVRQPGLPSSELLALSTHYREELSRRSTIRPSRVQGILEHIRKRELASAGREIETLSLLGIDLLNAMPTHEGIRAISLHQHTGQIIAITNAGSLRRFNTELVEVVPPLHFAESKVFFAAASATGAHILSHANKIEIYNTNCQPGIVEYDEDIRCIQIVELGGIFYWVAGFEDGRVVLDSTYGHRHQFTVSSIPLRMAHHIHGDEVDIYFITLDSEVYVWKNVVRQAIGTKLQSGPVQLTKLESRINALDLKVIPTDEAVVEILILAPNAMVRLIPRSQHCLPQIISLSKPVTCLAACRTEHSPYRMLVGTQDRSLQFFDFNDQIVRETYLADIPTAINVVHDDSESIEMYIGFAQGDIHRYRCVRPTELENLRRQCDRTPEFEDIWQSHSIVDKQVLIALTNEYLPKSQAIIDNIEPRLRSLFSTKAYEESIRSLERTGTTQGEVCDSSICYRLSDSEYCQWIRTHKSAIEEIRLLRNEVLGHLSMSDLKRVYLVLTPVSELLWLQEILGIDVVKWSRAMSLAEAWPSDLGVDEASALSSTFSERFYRAVGAVHINKAAINKGGSIVAEIAIPSVKFDGFDRINVLTLGIPITPDLGVRIGEFAQSSGARILVILVQNAKDFLKDILKDHWLQIAVMDATDIAQIALNDSPRSEFIKRIVRQINLAALSPFRTSGPVRKMFFGRERERQQIMNALVRPGAKSHAIVGPRRIGKTSLMFHIADEATQISGFRVLYFDITPYSGKIDQLKDAVLAELGIDSIVTNPHEFVGAIKRYCQDSKTKLVILFDEVDDFLRGDNNNDHVFFKTLRALVNEAKVKILIAGYDTLYFEMRNPGSPLFNMLDSIELSSLSAEEAYTLVSESFRYIFDIDSEAIENITLRTGRHPNFVQYCCHKLVEAAANSENLLISAEDVDKILKSRDLYDYMVDIYLENLDPRGLAILYLLAANYDPNRSAFVTDRTAHFRAMISAHPKKQSKYETQTLTPYILHRFLETEYQLNVQPQLLDILMKRLVLASILTPHEQGSYYSFTLPDFPELVRNHQEIELQVVNYLEHIDEILST